MKPRYSIMLASVAAMLILALALLVLPSNDLVLADDSTDKSSDASLVFLTLSGHGRMTPSFNPDHTYYQFHSGEICRTHRTACHGMAITTRPRNPNATIVIAGSPAYVNPPHHLGRFDVTPTNALFVPMTFDIVVTAEDGVTTKTYTVQVGYRLPVPPSPTPVPTATTVPTATATATATSEPLSSELPGLVQDLEHTPRDNGFELNWNPPEIGRPITGYQVEIIQVKPETFDSFKVMTSGESLGIDKMMLRENGIETTQTDEFKVRVWAINQIGLSNNPSDIRAKFKQEPAVTLPYKPGKVRELRVHSTLVSIAASWQPPAAGPPVQSYHLMLETRKTTLKLQAQTAQTSWTFDLTGLAGPGDKFTLKVWALSADGALSEAVTKKNIIPINCETDDSVPCPPPDAGDDDTGDDDDNTTDGDDDGDDDDDDDDAGDDDKNATDNE